MIKFLHDLCFLNVLVIWRTIHDMLIFALKMDFSPPTKEVWGKLIFSEACVKNSVHRGRGVPGQITPSQIRYLPGLGTTTPGPGTSPWDQVHSPGTRYTLGTRYTPLPRQCRLGDTDNKRAVMIWVQSVPQQILHKFWSQRETSTSLDFLRIPKASFHSESLNVWENVSVWMKLSPE